MATGVVCSHDETLQRAARVKIDADDPEPIDDDSVLFAYAAGLRKYDDGRR